MSHRRARFVCAAMLCLAAAAAFGQSQCPTPVIAQISGSNPSCAAQSVTLDAGSGWASYQWSNGATTRTITDAPSATASYTVTTTDANGCSATSMPYELSVYAVMTPPTITITPGTICSTGTAHINSNPSGWGWGTGTVWSVTNGTITRQDNQSVDFTATGAGPITVNVTANDANGCPGTASATASVGTSHTPVIHIFPDAICPGAFASAYIESPDPNNPGNPWSTVQWTIANGTISYQSGGSVGFSTNANGQPATLSVTATDNQGCISSATATTVVRSIPQPVIHVFPDSICAGAFASAYIESPDPNNPGNPWSMVQWTITHGTISYQSGGSVGFATDASGQPATLSVTATDNQYCTNTATASTVVRTIPPPVIHIFPDAICPGAFASAYIESPDPNNPGNPWSTVQWTITNGTISYQSGGSVGFATNPNGQPATLTVTATDNYGCTNSATATTVVRSIPPPVIHVYPDAVCPGAFGSAYINGPDPNNPGNPWSTVQWTITNGTITYQGGSAVGFTTNANGQPATLTVTATDNYYCNSSATATTVVKTLAPPVIHLYPTTVCAGCMASAMIDPPNPSDPYSHWSTVQWSVTNGTIANDHVTSIDFNTNAAGDPVTVTVTATDVQGCSNSASVTIEPVIGNAPLIHPYPANVCVNGGGGASLDPAPGGSPWSYVNWSVEHGTVIFGQGSMNMSFQADGSGNAVVLHASVQDSSNNTLQSSVTVPTRAPVLPVIAIASGSCPTTASVTNASLYTTFMWTADNAEIVGPWYQSSITFRPVQNGHVTLTVRTYDTNGCDTTSSIGYDVSGLPNLNMSLPGVPYCYGKPATASVPDAGPAVTYQWSLNSGHFLGSSTTPTVSFIPEADTLALTVTATNAAGCTSSNTAYILVERPPVGGFNSAPASVCANGTATISTYANGSTYDWQVTDGDIVSGAGTAAITFRPHAGVSTVTISLTKANPHGCAATYQQTIPVTAVTATITASGPTAICPGGSVTLTASAGASWLWSTGATTQSIAVSQPGSYTVTVSNAGCSATSVPTDVTAATAATPTITASGPTTFCAGGNVTLTASSGASYLWSTGATTQAITVNAAGSYSVTVTDAAGCSAASAPTSVTTTTVPQPTITPSGPITFCPGGSVTLTAPAGYASYQWSSYGGPLGTTQSITVATTTPIIRVTVTDANGCSAQSSSVWVTVRDTPTAQVYVPNSLNACAGGSVSLQISGTTGTYHWSNGATTSSITATQTGDYSYTVTDTFGCSATSAPVHVSIDPAPVTPAFTASPATICGSTSEVTFTVTNYASFSSIFYMTNGAMLSQTNGVVHVARALNSGQLYLQAYGSTPAGCQYIGQITLQESAGPSATITAPTTACAGSPSQASVADAGPGATYHWEWTTATGVTGSNTRTLSFTPYLFNNNPLRLYCSVTDANGCSRIDIKDITVLPQPAATITVTPAPLCDSGIYTATVPDAGPGAEYHWTYGNITQVSNTGRTLTFYPNTSFPVNLDVTVITASGCSNHGGITVTPLTTPPISVTANGPTTFCTGGSVTLTATSGMTSYLWSTGATTQSITVSQGGVYYVTGTGSNGCQARSTNTLVQVNPLPDATVTPSGPTTFCAGGSVTLSAPADFGDTYLWSTGATTQSITVSSSGSYSVTVRNADGCTKTSAPTTVTANAAPSASITPSGPTTFCAGGSVTLTASSGASYAWSTGATTRSITVASAGSYGVTVTDANGCSATSAPATVAVNAPPSPTIVVSQQYNALMMMSDGRPLIAAPESDGDTYYFCGNLVNVGLTALGGSTYHWSTGATTAHIAVSQSGTYTVTATDANGCSADASVVISITPYPTPQITANGPTAICPSGGSVTLTADAADSYLWSNGATTQSIVVTQAGEYSVTTTVNRCSGSSAPVQVTYAAPSIGASPAALCPGGSVTLTASSGASYLWSTGATTQSITATQPGNYSVTVTDAGGCATTASTTLAAPVSASLSTTTPTVCSNGQLSVSAAAAGGSAPYSYQWFQDGIALSATGASYSGPTMRSGAGTTFFTVRVTDAAGCQIISDPLAIAVDAAPVVYFGSNPASYCAGMTYTITAGPPGYAAAYQWSVTNATVVSTNGPAVTFVAGSSGDVTVSVTGSNPNGCTAVASMTAPIIPNNVPKPAISASGPLAFCAGGGVTLTAPSGYAYLWSTGATTQSISVGFAGSYSVTVTDSATSCGSSSDPVAVTVNPLPEATITASGPTTFCAGGSVALTASAGASWLWSNGATTQSITASSTGWYSVTVTSADGCSTTSQQTYVDVHPAVTANISANGPTAFCAGGSVTLTATSANSYLWSTGATTRSITVNASGNYSVTVTDSYGCSATSAPTGVTVNALPAATITAGGPTTFCTGGSVTLTASSGASYAWSTGATTQSITANSSGNYAVTVTNASGCRATSAPTSVTVNALPTATITAGGPTTFCAGGSVTLTASSGASYAWSTGATTQSITVNSSGNYTVTVTNANGCSATSAPTGVTVNALPAATITAGGPTTFCAGGSVTLTASSGASYAWSTGATTQSITVNSSGNYTVTVTNANGCSATSAPTAVIANALPTATITAGGPTTFCAGGSVTLTASSGASYAWSTGATTQSITVNSSGNYTVTVTNANGCSATSAPTAVTANALPTATITPNGPTTFCTGGSVTLTASSGASYAWSTGATTQSITVNASGSYTVTVTNANGCSATSAPTSVTVNAAPTATITAGGPTTFCAGGSVTLTASSGASYAWSTGATTQSIAVNASGNYTVTVTNASGCSATSSPKSVTVNPLPTPTITAGGPTTFCAGGSVTLTSSLASSYSWSNGATTRAITVNAGGSYRVTVTDANGCSGTSAYTVVTVNTPAPATITAGGPTSFCPGGSVTLTASLGASYLWTTGATTRAIAASAPGNYSVTVTDANGCSATSAPTAVTNKTQPTATVSGGGTVCAGSSATVTATLTGVAPFSVTWSDGNVQNVGGTTASRSVAPSSTTTYTVTSITDANCSGTSSGSATVTIKTLPAFTQPPNKTIPKNTSTTLTVTPTGTAPFTYQWYKGSFPSTTNLVGTAQSYTTPNLAKGTYTYWVRVTNSCGATSSATITVTAN